MVAQTLAAAYSKHILNEFLLQKYSLGHGVRDATSLPVKRIPNLEDVADDVPSRRDLSAPICIVGGGVAGLMVAMCLQAVGIYDFDILEATDRVGGRVFTKALDNSATDPHNYYDVGAMRIPQIPAMESTFNMIENVLNIKDKEATYIYAQTPPLEPKMYLYKPVLPPAVDAASQKFDKAIKAIVTDFTTDWNLAFKKWVMGDPPGSSIDNYSTRAWLLFPPQPSTGDAPWTYDETENAETAETSTGLFDQAFAETIIDYCDFAATTQGSPKPWFRLEGGMSVLTDAMHASVAGQGTPQIQGPGVSVTTNQAVTSMTDNGQTITVLSVDPRTNATLPPKDYAAVFNTTALACLERMDTSGLNLDDATLTGIRTLSYDRATKVAIKFKTPWWLPLMKDQIGGVSSSDLPISNVVYPSWNDGPDQPAVLMISYSWAQDATRMGAIVPEYSNTLKPQKDDLVVTVCLQNLAKLWSNTPGAPNFQQMLDMYVSHHAYAWSHDPWTGGAFALFGPGQFRNVYPNFFEPKCEGKFNICGEATSAHHAWIAGALDSAYTTVMTWLGYHGMAKEMIALKASPLGGGQGAHPAELDETLIYWSAKLSDQPELQGGKQHKQHVNGYGQATIPKGPW